MVSWGPLNHKDRAPKLTKKKNTILEKFLVKKQKKGGKGEKSGKSNNAKKELTTKKTEKETGAWCVQRNLNPQKNIIEAELAENLTRQVFDKSGTGRGAGRVSQ